MVLARFAAPTNIFIDDICVEFSFPSVCAVLFLGCGMVWKDDVSDIG
jgi:hypothetical protein